ncbi:MAG: glycosyltransferase family 4 protein [Ruminococcus sp.]|nr:glycosyltransferase family 4 protein [Ruminococcus sp.]
MKRILFLSFCRYDTLNIQDFYADILRQFADNGDYVCVVSLEEKKRNIPTHIKHEDNCSILHVKIGNYFNVNTIEKGFTLIQLESKVLSAIKKYFKNIKFDLILYATPPISFARVIRYIKNRDDAKSYLMLKDIFPQNAVDLGMMSKSGLSGIIYKYFRHKEKELYNVSDYIGCMSQANCDYLIEHNEYINSDKVEICPNCVEPQDLLYDCQQKIAVRKKYNIPQDKKIFIYGGNLGKPQDIPFIIKCIKDVQQLNEAFFLIVGDGTEFNKLKAFFDNEKPLNAKLLNKLPKDDYNLLVSACDVGLIFLDHRFTIPNFPSRLLSYMQSELPVLACTDCSSDIGHTIVEGGFGWWCESVNTAEFVTTVNTALNANLLSMGKKSKKFLLEHYTAKHGADIILRQR